MPDILIIYCMVMMVQCENSGAAALLPMCPRVLRNVGESTIHVIDESTIQNTEFDPIELSRNLENYHQMHDPARQRVGRALEGAG